MRTKWASCSTRGTVTLSLDLLQEPQPFREVVIVHELIHLMIPNHGRVFKALMKAYLPDWERISAGRVSRACGFPAPVRGRVEWTSPRPATENRAGSSRRHWNN
jgi:hypothetical protein